MSPRKTRAAGKGPSGTNAGPAGHAAVAFSMVQHDALPLILQHPSMCEQRTICSLLCSCKAVHAAVHTYCAGLVPLSPGAIRRSELKYLTRWLEQHACLIQTLYLKLSGNYEDEDVSDDDYNTLLEQAEAAVAAALQKAAAAAALPGSLQSPLQIQAYGAEPVSRRVDVLLNALPAATLTSLDLVVYNEIVSSRRAASALAGLTALEDVSLEMCGDGIARGLSALTSLTELCFRPIHNLSKISIHLPAQLKQLTFSQKTRDPKHFHLGHVTGLTRLENEDCLGRRGIYIVTDKDQLPPNLEVLDVKDVVSAQPLQTLQRLRHLVLRNSILPAEQLLQIASSLSNLTSFQLWYRCRWDGMEAGHLIQAPDAAAAAWHALPLTALVIRCDQEYDEAYRLSPASVQQISRLQGLTRLELWALDAGLEWPLGVAQLAAILKPLTNLQLLRLGCIGMMLADISDDEDSDNDLEVELAGLRELLESISGLSGLRSLGLRDWSLPGMAYRLGGATQLTELELEDCGLRDKDVTALARDLTGLQRLVLNVNYGLSNAMLPVIGLQLQQLTHLEIQETGIRNGAAQRLKQQLTQLKGLLVDVDSEDEQ